MAVPQRDNVIEAIKRLDALLECAAKPFPHLYKCGNGLMSPKTSGCAKS